MPQSETTAQQVDAPEAEEERLSDSDLMNMPVYDAVVLDLVRGWKIWESTYKRDYDESSEVFPQKLKNLLASAREVQEWNRKNGSDPRKPKLALNNSGDWDPKWFERPSKLGCIPLEEYISQLDQK